MKRSFGVLLDEIWRLRQCAQTDEGFVLPFVAICMVAILAFVGLALDGGTLFVVRTQLQKAADAAALAGAQDITATDVSATTASSVTDAQTYASYNGLDLAAGELTTNTYTCVYLSSCSSNSYDAWTVTAQRTVNLAFMPVIGIHSEVIQAAATAVKSPLKAIPASAVFPFAIWGGNPGGNPLDMYCLIACDSNGGLPPGTTGVIYRDDAWPGDVVYPDPSKCGGSYPPCNLNWNLGSQSDFHGFFNNMPSGLLQVGSSMTYSSGGTGDTPALCQYAGNPPTPLVVPVIGSAFVQSGTYYFQIAGWRVGYLDAANICPNESNGQAWTLTIAPNQTISVGVGGGSDPNAPMVLKLWS